MDDVETPTADGHDSLAALRRYLSPSEGLVEEFLEYPLGPDRAFGLLAGPLSGQTAEPWLITPSIGQEHGNLRRLEAVLARRLATAGISTLRIRPDVGSDGVVAAVDLDARLAEVTDAVALLRRRGVPPAGAIGVQSGSMTAMLACEAFALQGLVAIEPVRRGRQYVRESLRRQAVNDLMSVPEESDAESPLRQLETTGTASIRGLELTKSAYERIAGLDFVEQLSSFRGRSLLVGISAAGATSPQIVALQERLTELGGEVTVEIVEEDLPVPLGEYYYENVGPLRHDTRLDLDLRLAEVTSGWIVAGPVTLTPS